jgi:hypothetical protein
VPARLAPVEIVPDSGLARRAGRDRVVWDARVAVVRVRIGAGAVAVAVDVLAFAEGGFFRVVGADPSSVAILQPPVGVLADDPGAWDVGTDGEADAGGGDASTAGLRHAPGCRHGSVPVSSDSRLAPSSHSPAAI